MIKPEIVDLYCCQGAASWGYEMAGWTVREGIDITPQSRYPYRFQQWDAINYLNAVLEGLIPQAQAYHAAPPCQGRTNAQKIQGREHPRLIGPTRDLLLAIGVPYIIENTPLMAGAEDVDPMKDPVMLCGSMFPGLRTYRHREFESNVPLIVSDHRKHLYPQIKMGRPLIEGDWYQAVGNFSNVPYVRANMGVPWMTREGIRECTPPVYTEYFGRQLLEYV
jgi:DNA (cytosine-5)-methyltransferase 1